MFCILKSTIYSFHSEQTKGSSPPTLYFQNFLFLWIIGYHFQPLQAHQENHQCLQIYIHILFLTIFFNIQIDNEMLNPWNQKFILDKQWAGVNPLLPNWCTRDAFPVSLVKNITWIAFSGSVTIKLVFLLCCKYSLLLPIEWMSVEDHWMKKAKWDSNHDQISNP